MTAAKLAHGAAVAAAAAAIAGLDILWMPGIVQAHVLPILAGAGAATSEAVFVAAVFGTLIVAAAIGGLVTGGAVFAMGRAAARNAAFGLAAGAAGVSVAAGYAALAGSVQPGVPGWSAGLILLGAGTVAIQVAGEELFFRGWLQPALVTRWGAPGGLVATALLFAAIHVLGGARAPVSLVNLFLGGLVFGWFALRSGGLAGAVAAHWGWNATEQLVWGLDPNPGVGGFGALFDRELVGAALWGGSGEGLNASLGMSFALLAILVPLTLAHRRTGPVSRRSTETG